MATDDVARLWSEYAKSKSIELRNQLVAAHWGMVEATVGRFKRGDLDLVQVAAENAIVAAVERYDPGRGRFRVLFKLVFSRELTNAKRAARRERSVNIEFAASVAASRCSEAWIDEVAAGAWSRELLTRRYVYRQTVVEIAASMGLRVSVAMAELHRAEERAGKSYCRETKHAPRSV